MNWFILLLYALVTFRLAELLVIDDGPFEILPYFRSWSYSQNIFKRNIGAILTCVHCSAIWISLVLAFTIPYKGIVELFVNFLSVAGLASIFLGKLGRS